MKQLIAIHFLLFCLTPLVFGQDLTAIEDMLKEECKDKVVDFVADLSKCMQNVFGNAVQFIAVNPDEAVKAICNSNFRKCIDEFEENLIPCIKDEKIIKAYDEQEKALTAVLKYTCKDDGKPLKDFFQDGVKCFAEKSVTDKVASCASTQELQNTLHNLQDDESCKQAGKQSLCVLDALEQCSTKAARSFIGGALWESLRSTRCKAIIEKDYSRINSGMSVTFNLFLLIAMAFVAKFCF